MAANGKPLVLPGEERSRDDVALTIWFELVAQVVAAILARRTDQPTRKPNGASAVQCPARGKITDDASR